MLAMRRAARHLRTCLNANFTYYLRVPCVIENRNYSTYLVSSPEFHQPKEQVLLQRFRERVCSSKEADFYFYFSRRFSSQSHVRDEAGENDEEDPFSELEFPPEGNKETGTEALLNSDSDMSESDEDADGVGVKENGKPLLQVVLKCGKRELSDSLDRWINEGNLITRQDAINVHKVLRKRRDYYRALEVSNWLSAKKPYDLDEGYYATHLDLTFKTQGISRAQMYLDSIPSEFRGCRVYRTFLANCSSCNNVQKAEEVFNKMKELGFPLEAFDYDQLLLLYSRFDKMRTKVVHVLNAMKIDGIKPDHLAYTILVDVKGRVGDIAGMEEIVENMKSEGHEVGGRVHMLLARYYKYAGMADKAELAIKEAEKYIDGDTRLLGQIVYAYATSGKAKEVERLYEYIETIPSDNLRTWGFMACITAWGKLGEIDKAEQLFEKMIKSGKGSIALYNTLLKVYAEQGLVPKGAELVKKMTQSGVAVDLMIYNTLVKLYLKVGDLQKADYVMSKALTKKGFKPMYKTMLLLFKGYARKGDIANSEKYFQSLRNAGYLGKTELYESLLRAYVNAGMPPYGFRERMMADRVIPTRVINDLLLRTQANKESAEELLNYL